MYTYMEIRSIEDLNILGCIAVLVLISLFWAQNAGLPAQLQPAYGWPSGIWYMYRAHIRLILRKENAHMPCIPGDIPVGPVPSTGCTVHYLGEIWLIPAVNIGAI